MTDARKIILDTDPGVGVPGTDADDPIALMLALRDPRLELLGVTTVFGNCPPDLGARGARAVLDAASARDVPVSVGADRPLSGALPATLEDHRGERGRAGIIALPTLAESVTGQHAADFLIEQVHRHPGEITIVAIGPHTNIALALQKDPSLRDEIAGIVFMGGALGIEPTYGRGNITTVAECNIWYDAPAADIVFRSGIDLTMVGLDVTNPAKGVILEDTAIERLDASDPGVEGMLAAVCATYLAAPMFDLAHGCVLYDPLAVAVAADPEIGVFEDRLLAVETAGELTTGQTVEVPQGSRVRVMTDVDGARAVQDILAHILDTSKATT